MTFDSISIPGLKEEPPTEEELLRRESSDTVESGVMKPCPFCGAKAKVEQSVVFKKPIVTCTGCNAVMGAEYGSHFTYPSDAINAWNQRAS